MTFRFCFSEFPVSVVAVGFLMKREEREKKDPLSFSLPSVSLDSQTDWIKNDRELHVRRKEDRRKKLGKQKE